MHILKKLSPAVSFKGKVSSIPMYVNCIEKKNHTKIKVFGTALFWMLT